MSTVPTVSRAPEIWPATEPSARLFSMGGWSTAGVIGATKIATTTAVMTLKVLGFAGYCLSLMIP
jgi:hypothetical protein